MRKILSLSLVCALLLAVALPAQKIVVGTTDSIKPFAAPVDRVLKDAGFTMELQVMPVARLTQAVTDSSVAGAFFVSEQLAQAMTGSIKVPIVLFKNEAVAVAIKPDIKVTSPADLAKYKVGIVRGNPLHEAVTKGLNPVLADNEESEFKMLAAGRFEVAILARSLVADYCKKAGIEKYYVQEPAVIVTPLYFVLSAKNAALEPKVTAAFKKAMDNGTWTKEINALVAPAK